jgi:transcriptional repressor NrdR
VVHIKCPYCSSNDIKVIDKRDTDNNTVIRRRRECTKCRKRFTTYEHVGVVDLFVVKKDGKRVPFDRQKLLEGIMKACEKRPIKMDRIESVVNKIEAELLKKEGIEIKSSQIGELVMKHLKKLDQVAYIRFASVYREFTDLTTFKKELDNMLKKGRK